MASAKLLKSRCIRVIYDNDKIVVTHAKCSICMGLVIVGENIAYDNRRWFGLNMECLSARLGPCGMYRQCIMGYFWPYTDDNLGGANVARYRRQ